MFISSILVVAGGLISFRKIGLIQLFPEKRHKVIKWGHRMVRQFLPKNKWNSNIDSTSNSSFAGRNRDVLLGFRSCRAGVPDWSCNKACKFSIISSLFFSVLHEKNTKLDCVDMNRAYS